MRLWLEFKFPAYLKDYGELQVKVAATVHTLETPWNHLGRHTTTRAIPEQLELPRNHWNYPVTIAATQGSLEPPRKLWNNHWNHTDRNQWNPLYGTTETTAESLE